MQTAGTTTNLRRGAALAAALVLALGTAACGGDDGDTSGDAPSAASGEQGAGSSTTPAPATSAADAPTPAPKPADEPVATKEGSLDGDPITLDILELKRSGGTLVLNYQLKAEAGSGIKAQVGDSFANDVYEKDPDGETLDSFTLDGVTLTDTKNRKLHLVARDAENHCVCSNGLSSVFVEDAAPLQLTATFGPPPADVKAMNVTIPSFGTFSDVPLS